MPSMSTSASYWATSDAGGRSSGRSWERSSGRRSGPEASAELAPRPADVARETRRSKRFHRDAAGIPSDAQKKDGGLSVHGAFCASLQLAWIHGAVG